MRLRFLVIGILSALSLSACAPGGRAANGYWDDDPSTPVATGGLVNGGADGSESGAGNGSESDGDSGDSGAEGADDHVYVLDPEPNKPVERQPLPQGALDYKPVTLQAACAEGSDSSIFCKVQDLSDGTKWQETIEKTLQEAMAAEKKPGFILDVYKGNMNSTSDITLTKAQTDTQNAKVSTSFVGHLSAPHLVLKEGAELQLFGSQVDADVVLEPQSTLLANATLKSLQNGGRLTPFAPLAEEKERSAGSTSWDPTQGLPIPSDNKAQKAGTSGAPEFYGVGLLIQGDYTQTENGVFAPQLDLTILNNPPSGVMRVNGTIHLNGTLESVLNVGDTYVLMVSPQEIDGNFKAINQTMQSATFGSVFAKNVLSLSTPKVSFEVGSETMHGVLGGHQPIQTANYEDFTRVTPHNTLECDALCQDSEVKVLESSNAATVQQSLQNLTLNEKKPNVVVKGISDAGQTLTQASGGAIYLGDVNLGQFVLQGNAQAAFYGITWQGNIDLKAVNKDKPALLASGTITGHLQVSDAYLFSLHYGEKYHDFKAQEQYQGINYNLLPVYALVSNNDIDFFSYPVSLHVQGDYTQKGGMLSLTGGILAVDGQASFTEKSTILSGYKSTENQPYAALLMVSKKPIQVAKDSRVLHQDDQGGLVPDSMTTLDFENGIYALAVIVSPRQAEKPQSYAAQSVPQSRGAKRNLQALKQLEAPYQTLEGRSETTGQRVHVRVPQATPLIRVRDTLMSQDGVAHQDAVRCATNACDLTQALSTNARTRLYLGNDALFTLLNTAQDPGVESFEVRFDASLFIGHEQRRTHIEQLSLSKRLERDMLRVTISHVGNEFNANQDPKKTDYSAAAKALLSSGRSLGLGVSWQHPILSHGLALNAQLSYLYTQNKVISSFVKALDQGNKTLEYGHNSVQADLVLSTRVPILGAFSANASEPSLLLSPFAGYRFAIDAQGDIHFKHAGVKVDVKQTQYLRNNLLAGVGVLMNNALNVSGLRLSASALLNYRLNDPKTIEQTWSDLKQQLSIGVQDSAALTAQAKVGVSYEIGILQAGAQMQMLIQDHPDFSFGANVSLQF